MPGFSAKRVFEQARRAVSRLHEVQLALMNHCEDWRPPSARSRIAKPDPTASTAIRNVDELEGRLEALRAEEAELIDQIGEALALVEAVRAGLGEKYAVVLEVLYIDCVPWREIESMLDISRTTGWRYVDIACDWLTSVGMTRILAGDLEV